LTAARTPIRCLIVVPVDLRRSAAGGIRAFVEGFIKFAPDDFDIEVVGVGRGQGGWQKMDLDGRTIRTLAILQASPERRNPVIPLTLRFLLAIFRQRDVIATEGRILQAHRPGLLLPFVRRNAPMIQFLHFDLGQIARGIGENRWRLLPSLLQGLERITLPRAAAIVAVSEATARDYARRHPHLADRISVISNWVDDTVFFAQPDTQRKARRTQLHGDLGAAPGDHVALIVGRLELIKDPGLAIEAVTRVPLARPWHLVFVGDGSLRKALRQRAVDRGVESRVHFLGSLGRDEVAGLMNAADVLIVPSRSESGPTVAIEALACGLPVVGTRVGRLPDLIRTGENGWLAQIGSAEEIAAGLQWAADVGDRHRDACIDSARPYHAHTVLGPLYELHRRHAR